ncbi:DUF3833 family protein [Marinibacterium profundimaris]|uniref:DUF3833 family protein n=1 Tax=Marinibacterium profundimaris TaxID=1679460 RepID=UPI000B52254F|nr:DUF3833 family protein [Marinibacterium profundimaris]
MQEILLVALGAALMALLFWFRHRYASFAAQAPGDYCAGGPEFDPRRHLNGAMTCDGVTYGPTGRVVSRFTADFDIAWTGDTGIMREHFRYDDGSSRDREWHLTLMPDGRIEARADDVPGLGRGMVSGPTLGLRYRLRLPESSGGHVLDAVDWMYLTPDGTIMNRSQFRKFGITVAELVATMRPVGRAEARGADPILETAAE